MNRTPNTRRGFTLVELLVVVLILAILMAVALPLYLNAIHNSEKGTARANMQTIANAEQSAKLADPNHKYVIITSDADYIPAAGKTGLPDLAAAIKGPGTRHYTVDAPDGAAPAACKDANNADVNPTVGTFAVHSSEPDDGCFVPGLTVN